MRGLVLWMCSQVSPMRSSAPGAKFSTSTSQVLISRLRISLPLRMLGVDGDRALVVVEHGEIQPVGVHVAQLAARDVADAGTLDLDDVGAHPGEQLRAGRARLHMGEIENAHAVRAPCRPARRAWRSASAGRCRSPSWRCELHDLARALFRRGFAPCFVSPSAFSWPFFIPPLSSRHPVIAASRHPRCRPLRLLLLQLRFAD